MRVLIFAALIAIAYSARLKNVTPAFTFSEERSSNGSPSVSVVFPDGYEDTLVLNKYHANEEDRIANEEHCNYLGHLAKEPEACVAMTGCFGSEDVHFTILSVHAEESSMFMMTKDGKVEIIDSSFKNGLKGKIDGLVVPREDPNNIEVVEGDEEIIPEIAEAIFAAEENCDGNTCTLPATQHLQIRVGYGDNLKNLMGGSTSLVENNIKSVWTHLQANFCHSSLGSKVLIERLPGIKYYAGETIKCSWDMTPHTKADLNGADLMAFIGTGGGGTAWVGVICDNQGWQKKYKGSITGYGNGGHAGVGFVMAHEVGHNLGMFHDFDKQHGGSGNPCDNSGFMSYGPKVFKWSECSVKDFTAKYTVNKDIWCLPAAPNACPGTNPDPVDCQWGPWSSCSTTCGNGKRTRSISQTALNGGSSCNGASSQTCNLQACPGQNDHDALKNGGKDCWNGCNKKQGKCDWCGADGFCCRMGWIGNECDGSFGGANGHQCVLNTSQNDHDALKNGGKDCWNGCNKKQGKCAWCGADGFCCRMGWIGNGCDGSFGGPNGHQCVLNTSQNDHDALKNGGKDCWNGCNKKQGKCTWCGTDGFCCRMGWIGNGCDGSFGGANGHQCVLKL